MTYITQKEADELKENMQYVLNEMNKTNTNFDKTISSFSLKFYSWCVSFLSLLALLATIILPFYDQSWGAFVTGLVFLTIWILRLISVTIISLVSEKLKSDANDFRKDLERLK